MTSLSLAQKSAIIQRFSHNFPCPICGGYDEAPRGSEQRCYGFLSGDGNYANCTRKEHAGGIPINPKSGTYAHRLKGSCKCGKEHGSARLNNSPKSNNGTPAPNRKPTHVYEYLDEEEKLLYQVLRYADPKGFNQRRPGDAGNWVWGLDEREYYQSSKGDWYKVDSAKYPIPENAPRKTFPAVRHVLYRLPELLKSDPAQPVYFVEGEKDVDNLREIGLTAITTAQGAKGFSLTAEHAREILANRIVIHFPDNDTDGAAYGNQVAGALHDVTASIKVVALPGLPPKGDVSDWIETRKAEGMTAPEIKAALLDIVNHTPEWQPSQTETAPTGAAADESPGEKESKPTVAAILIRMSQDAELYHTKDDRGVATFSVGEHRETAYIKSPSFRRWLRHRYFKETQKPPNTEGMQQAFETLEGIAIYEGKPQEVYIRTAVSGGNIYIDLGNENWEAVQCTSNGWDVIAHPPVKFIRPKGMLPLPEPIHGGNARDMQRFINIKQESSDLQLILSWIVNAFRHDYPFPVLVLLGEQGSAKSTVSKMIRALVDPNIAPIRSAPREEKDLFVSASRGWVICFDNLSGLPNSLSDALCRISIDGGYATRELYTNEEETIFHAIRPIILNGITDVVTRPDLLDRSLIITLEPIPENKRKAEADLWTSFNQATPGILGGLLDAVCAGLRNIESVHMDRLPRMADFARFATAAETGLGFEAGSFIKAYADNRKDAISSSLDADPLAQAIRELMDGEDFIEEAPADLLARLEEKTPATEKVKRSRYLWPQNARSLTNHLKRIAPLLRTIGIDVQRGEKSHGRTPIILTRIKGETTSPTSPTSPDFSQLPDNNKDTKVTSSKDEYNPTSPTSPDVTRNVTHHKPIEISKLIQENGDGVTKVTSHPPIIGDTVEVRL